MTTDDKVDTKVELTPEQMKAEIARLKPFEDQYKGLQTKHNKVMERNKELTNRNTSSDLSITAALKRVEDIHLATARLLAKSNDDKELEKVAVEVGQRRQTDEYRSNFMGELDSVLEPYDANFNKDPDLEDAREALKKGRAEEALAITKMKLAERNKVGTKTLEELVQEQVEVRMKQVMKVDTNASTAAGTKKSTGDELIAKGASGAEMTDDETEELMKALGMKALPRRRK